MGFFAWLIVGAIAGWLAGKVMGTSRQQGLLLDIVVGIAGALIGGFLFNEFGTEGTTGFNIWSIFVAFTGAVVPVCRVGSGIEADLIVFMQRYHRDGDALENALDQVVAHS